MTFSNILNIQSWQFLKYPFNLFSIIDKSTPFLETLKTSSPLNLLNNLLIYSLLVKC